MKSIDTNILVYGTNRSCPEHIEARALLETIARQPDEWIVADQVLFEYYRVVRSPHVLEHPLSAVAAAHYLTFIRNTLGCLHCGYSVELFDDIVERLSGKTFRAGRTFDLVLAITLSRQGVTTFYTHNPTDFRAFGLFEVVDPIG